jgi:isoamylase
MTRLMIEQRIDAYPTERIGGYAVRPGRALPFGVAPVPGGLNFSVYSNNATAVTLVLYRRGEPDPVAELLIPDCFRTGGVYAITVFGLDPETTEYGYRVQGPFRPSDGHRFDPSIVLLDPYARLLAGRETWGGRAGRYRCAVGYDDFDWAGDRPLGLPAEDLVIYELHVRGFTQHPASAVRHPGTFAGLAEKIGYLRELGVNCVELMPVCEFDETANPAADYDYWGYNPIGLFAPKASYATTGPHGMQVDELKNLVKQFHRAGLEVILDVVFNHTGEGDERGPTLAFRGIDNACYYMHTPDGQYYNFSGTGNTLNCNNPVVRGFILDCLRYWATEYHIDGFRFDLASILGRAEDGSVLANPPLLESLAHDPVLRDCKLIAEAWDAAGLCQVGSFPHHLRWSEWNGQYRDTVRRFLRGDPGTVPDLATRITGSADLYARRTPTASVNFITAHDGFTLADLVSYNDKHNEANGENSRDGMNDNLSWNCGVEGPTDDPEIVALRHRQVRTALLLLLCSWGIPMLVAGDEAGRTQHGNNNAYCHDGPLTWFDWDLADKHTDLRRFVRYLIGFRQAHPALRRAHYPGPARNDCFPALSWHGVRAWAPDWAPHNRLLAVMFCREQDCVYLAANSWWEPQTVELPELPAGMAWCQFADTAAAPPGDAAEPGSEPVLADQRHVTIAGRSAVALNAKTTVVKD